MSKRIAACLLLVVIGVNGCQTARHVVKQSNGGIVAIPANSDSWPFHHRRNAEELMAQHCPNGYVIEREEEVITGTVTNHDQQVDSQVVQTGNKFLPGGVVETTRNTTSTHHTKEWQITYRAK